MAGREENNGPRQKPPGFLIVSDERGVYVVRGTEEELRRKYPEKFLPNEEDDSDDETSDGEDDVTTDPQASDEKEEPPKSSKENEVPPQASNGAELLQPSGVRDEVAQAPSGVTTPSSGEWEGSHEFTFELFRLISLILGSCILQSKQSDMIMYDVHSNGH